MKGDVLSDNNGRVNSEEKGSVEQCPTIQRSRNIRTKKKPLGLAPGSLGVTR